jgi:hypothetical protein
MAAINKRSFIVLIVFLALCTSLYSQEDMRTQYPPVIRDSYFSVNIGAINYRFSSAQLEAGHTVESVKVPHTAVRIILLGHQFTPWLSAQVSYMRPVDWVEYKNIDGDQSNHSVWMNVGGLTFASRLLLSKKWSLAAEAGFGLITRKGFSINNIPVVTDATYGTLLSGAALQYHLNSKWDLQLRTVWSPAHKKVKQPQTLFISAGFNYNMRPLSAERVARNAKSGYKFPKHFLLAGYTSHVLGYGVNDFVSKGPVPVFWGGEAKVKQGFSLSYQRNIFHARKVFALDWGGGISYWKSRNNNDDFLTVSLYPVFRFNAIRSTSADIFFEYAVAGPAFISKTIIDGRETGKKFTFHDFMGMGVIAGKRKSVYAGLRIAHFSNGNLFPRNDGVMIPLTFNLGYCFE